MRRSLILAFALAFSAAGAWADRYVDCTQDKDRALKMRACTEIIERREEESPQGRVRAYAYRCLAHIATGQVDRAIADCTKAIELDPNFGIAYFYRANIYALMKDDRDRARADYKKAVELDPEVRAFLGKGEFDSAVTDYTTAIARDPNDDRAYTNRGLVYALKGEFDRAVADFTKAIALDPKTAKVYTYRGQAYAHKGVFGRAIVDYTKAIALDPKSDAAYNNRGISYFETGELDRAIADFDQAIALNPMQARPYFGRGLAYIQKGQVALAEADLKQAIALDPNFVPAYINKGTLYSKKGDYDLAKNFNKKRALADFRKALEINPSNQHAKEGLKRLGIAPEAFWWRGAKSVEGTAWRSVATPKSRVVRFKPRGILSWGTPRGRPITGNWSQSGDVVELEIHQCTFDKKMCTEGTCDFIIDNRVASAECTWDATTDSAGRKKKKTSIRFQKVN